MDFTNCKYIDDLRDVIEKSLPILINGYGRNLDALADNICCLYNTPITLFIIGLQRFSGLGKYEGEYTLKLIEVFKYAQETEDWLTVDFVS